MLSSITPKLLTSFTKGVMIPLPKSIPGKFNRFKRFTKVLVPNQRHCLAVSDNKAMASDIISGVPDSRPVSRLRKVCGVRY